MSISSPDVDNDGLYEPDLDCVWKVITGVNHVVSLQFSRFVLHDDESSLCPDYVEVISTVISATLPANTNIFDIPVGIVLLKRTPALHHVQKKHSVHFFLISGVCSHRILSWR